MYLLAARCLCIYPGDLISQWIYSRGWGLGVSLWYFLLCPFQDTLNIVVKMNFCPDISSYERGSDFDPSVMVQVTEELWVNSHGETTQPPTHMIFADRDEVSQ